MEETGDLVGSGLLIAIFIFEEQTRDKLGN